MSFFLFPGRRLVNTTFLLLELLSVEKGHL
jgi:hypothetical protein